MHHLFMTAFVTFKSTLKESSGSVKTTTKGTEEIQGQTLPSLPSSPSEKV